MLMMSIGKFCELFGLRDREESTVVLFDESWIFNSSKNGRAIIKSMRRVGRSFNNTLIIVTQSVKDTAEEDDTGNFGRIFAYDDKDEREDILRHLGLEITNENIEWLKNLPKYHCLYLDYEDVLAKCLSTVLMKKSIKCCKRSKKIQVQMWKRPLALRKELLCY